MATAGAQQDVPKPERKYILRSSMSSYVYMYIYLYEPTNLMGDLQTCLNRK